MTRTLSIGPAAWPPTPDAPRSAFALRDVAGRAANRLFETLDMGLTRTGDLATQGMWWPAPVSMLPFTGVHVAGSLVLHAPATLMPPQHGVPADPEVHADWARELANLLMGSIKTALLQQGLIVELGIPTSIRGNEIRIVRAGHESIGFRYERDGAELLVAVFASFAAPIDIQVAGEMPTFDVLLF